MLPSFASAGNRLALALAALRGQGVPTLMPAPGIPLVRPDLARLAQPEAALPAFVAHDAVTRKYLDLLGPLDWAHFPERPIIAWVKENNPKAYVSERYDKTEQPKGDPDCKLGCKKRHNKGDGDGGPATTAPTAPVQPATLPPSMKAGPQAAAPP